MRTGVRPRIVAEGPSRKESPVKVLVAYATRHGATQGIAEQIAATIRSAGLNVDLRKIDDVHAVDDYDAVVIGSAAYYFHWLKEASSFVREHAQALKERPVWLFSSGPVSPDKVDAQGRDVLKGSEPREFAEFPATLGVRGQRVFFGAFDPEAEPVGLMERFTRALPAVRDALPAGDFRDWQEIEKWSRQIAGELQLLQAPALVPA
jgi:menaquinone-dependent protoporphyrinogen oxidase